MSSMYTLEDLGLDDLRGTNVFVRVDFNVPLEGGAVMDDTRLRAALPTLAELRAAGARLLLASHCGRPSGAPDPKYSLRPVVGPLSELLGTEVVFADDCVGAAALGARDRLGDGGICLLENLRFHPGEKANDAAFAEQLAALAGVYVGDAFGTAHRAHASVVGVAERTPRRAAGRLLVAEVEALGRLLESPARPFAGVVGGAKIEGKVDTLVNLLPNLDLLILGGGMANTFLAARGHDLAASLVERDRIELAGEILDSAARGEVEVLLPTDLVVTDDLADPKRIATVAVDELQEGDKAVDLGEASRAAAVSAIARAKTVFWNGPMGVFETPPFDAGTLAIAEGIAGGDAFTVVGGGETVAAVTRAGVTDRISHISTGGGASLEFLAGRRLPGVVVLERKP